MSDIKQPFTKNAAAEYLSVSVRTIDRFIAAGKLPSVKLGHRVYIPADALTSIFNTEGDSRESVAG